VDNVLTNCRTVVEPTNDVDIAMAISKLKNITATGHYQIPTEWIKQGGKVLKNVIYEIISNIWEEDIIPHEWKCDIIYPVHEKGDVMTCDNCRTVTLLYTVQQIKCWKIFYI
jgi:hypothetical protein